MFLKYHIVKPKYSVWKRGCIIFLFNFIVVGTIVSAALHFSSNKIQSIIVLLLTVLSVFVYFIGKNMLKYDTIGQLTIKEDLLEIQSSGLIKKINYKEIEKIEYCGSLPDTLTIKSTSNHKSYLLKIQDKQSNITLIDVTRESFNLIEDEANRNWQHIEKTLNETIPISQILFNPNLRSV